MHDTICSIVLIGKEHQADKVRQLNLASSCDLVEVEQVTFLLINWLRYLLYSAVWLTDWDTCSTLLFD